VDVQGTVDALSYIEVHMLYAVTLCVVTFAMVFAFATFSVDRHRPMRSKLI
jgi:hypothetical protein